jgi:hypothetical protein
MSETRSFVVEQNHAPVVAGRPGRPSKAWGWFVLAFAIQAAAWATWFVIASHHRVQEVPLQTSR